MERHNPSANSLDVTAIVISYNSEDRIEAAVAAHEAALSHLKAEVIVVDNASADRSVELAKSAIRSGHVIANTENTGYGHAANQGIVAARGETCLILNDDARLGADAIDRLLEVLKSDDRIALVGPRIVDEDGNPMPSARTTYPGFGEETDRIKDILRREHVDNRYPEAGDGPVDVAWLVGACILGKTSILRETGGFNPAFFLYVEDIDLCKRLTELGHRVVTVPDAVCTHTGSVSTSNAFSDIARIERRANAREIFYRIWYSRPKRAAIHLRRAIGRRNQPWRMKFHLWKVLSDGGSMSRYRFPPALDEDALGANPSTAGRPQ